MERYAADASVIDLERRHPKRAVLIRRLGSMQLSTDLIASVIDAIPAQRDPTDAARTALWLLANRIPVTPERILEGRFAIVGQSGVGKTTITQELALSHAQDLGRDQVGVIAVRDWSAHQPTEAVYPPGVDVIHDAVESVPAHLEEWSSRRVVFLDMPSVNPRDPHRVRHLWPLMDRRIDVQSILALSAAAPPDTIRETLNAFDSVRPAALALTRLDESTQLGGLLSVLMTSKLPLHVCSEIDAGQPTVQHAAAIRPRLVRIAIENARQRIASRETGESYDDLQKLMTDNNRNQFISAVGEEHR